MPKQRQTMQLEPTCLQWARKRAGLTTEALAAKTHVSEETVLEWETTGEITTSASKRLANATHTPLGYLFLPEPPVDQLPIDDFRTIDGRGISDPSPDLLDVIYDALRRQEWYREYVIADGGSPLAFVGSLRTTQDVAAAAGEIRRVISWDSNLRARIPSSDDALRMQIEAVEAAGILVMRSGIVGSNTHRPLSLSEFRGFALADDYAPVLFINGKDAISAQMFTLAHELVHIWLGVSGVSNLKQTYSSSTAEERFCNSVAAELLVAQTDLAQQWDTVKDLPNYVDLLRRHFKVSSLVILRRLRDAQYINEDVFTQLYSDELAQCIRPSCKSGGNSYNNLRSRVGKRLAAALVESAIEGQTAYRDAFQLLGVATMATFRELARRMGVAA